MNMNPALDPALLSRLSGQFTQLSSQLSTIGRDLGTLQSQVATVPVSAPAPTASQPVAPQPAPAALQPQAPRPAAATAYAAPALAGEALARAYAHQRAAGHAAARTAAATRAQAMGGTTPARPAPTAAPSAHQAHSGAWSAPTAQGAAGSGSGIPPHTGWNGPSGPAGAAPVQPREPWWQRDGVISRILALAGVGVTLVGVVMLLVLAAQAGLFGPPVRVVSGALLSAGLIIAGARVFGRPGGRVGGIALTATGFAGLYLDVLAVTTIYEWFPSMVGLVLAMACAAGGVALAMRWRSELLAVIVNVGCAVLAPVLTEGINLTLVAFLIIFQVAGAFPEMQRGWTWIAGVRTTPVVLALVGIATVQTQYDVDSTFLIAAFVVAVIGVGSGLVASRRRPKDVVAAVAMGVACLPALVAAGMYEPVTAAVLGTAIAASVVAAAFAARPLPFHTQITVAVIATIAVFQSCTLVAVDVSSALPFLIVGLTTAAAAVSRELKTALAVSGLFSVTGLMVFLGDAHPMSLAYAPSAVRELGAAEVLCALMVIAIVALIGLALRRMNLLNGEVDTPALVALGAVAVYAATAFAVAAAVTVSRSEDGFFAGHFIATVLWMVAACSLLALGLRQPAYARLALGGGLTLTAAALVKLFTFDLGALGGMSRAATFLVVGVLLLVAGTKYARAFGERDEQRQHIAPVS